MNSEEIERSKRLEECAKWLYAEGKFNPEQHSQYEKLMQWAVDIRSIIIPVLGDKKTIIYFKCNGCKSTAMLSHDKSLTVKPVSLKCICGVETLYNPTLAEQQANPYNRCKNQNGQA